MNRTKLAPETLIKIIRTVKGTESRQVITETVAEALAALGGSDFSTTHGTVLVSAALASDSAVDVGYDAQAGYCYTVEDDIPHHVSIFPADILDARTCAGLTQTEAAALIGKTTRAWQYWEAGERQMDPALFELFTMKIAPMFDARIEAAAKLLKQRG